MAGLLTIHSDGDGVEVNILSGHSWIEYHKDGEPNSRTYGTWYNPRGQGRGLYENLEILRQGKVTRQVRLDDEQEKKFYAKIDHYKALGRDAWQFSNPCAGFAADAWQAATGEYLNSRTNGVTSNPSCLKDAITVANLGVSATPSTRVAETLGRAVGAAVTSPIGIKVSAAVGKTVVNPLINKVLSEQSPAPGTPPTRSKDKGIGR